MAFDYSIRGWQERNRKRIVESNGREFARQNVPGTPKANQLAEDFVTKRLELLQELRTDYDFDPKNSKKDKDRYNEIMEATHINAVISLVNCYKLDPQNKKKFRL